MNLQEFLEKFLPDYGEAKGEFERTNSMDEFEEYLIDRFSEVLQAYTDRICEKQRENCVESLCDEINNATYRIEAINDSEQPKIEEL